MKKHSSVEECVFVCVLGCLLTLGSSGTGAFVGIDQVNAGAPILARLRETLIDLHRAVGPHIARYALREKGTRERGRRSRGRKTRKKTGRSLIND